MGKTSPAEQEMWREERNRSTAEQTQTVNPYEPAEESLARAIQQADYLYSNQALAPGAYTGERVAGFGDTSQLAQQMILQQASMGSPLTDRASASVSDMMLGGANPSLEAVKQNALGSAIPAAVAMFSGSGMANATPAMDYVGRAALDAVAPYEYGAWDTAQNRALSAAGMAPMLEQAAYLPSQMVAGVGGMRDAMEQARLDAALQQFREEENARVQNYQNYLAATMGLAGMGSTATGTSVGEDAVDTYQYGTAMEPESSFGTDLASSVMGGLGTYGALMTNPVTAPFAVIGGLASGISGLF